MVSSVVKKLLPGAAGTAGAGGGDDDFNLVSGLFNFDGSNGGQNETVIDSSSNNLTVTTNNTAGQSTFSPFTADEGKWSVKFPVGQAADELEISPSTSGDFALGTGAFTIECWAFVTADSYPYSRIMNIGPYWNNAQSIALLVHDTDNGNKISLGVYGAITNQRVCLSTNATPENEWFHVAVTRDSTGDFRLFVNGNLDSTNTSYRTFNHASGGNPALAIGNGGNRTVEEPFEGYISNFRFVKGTALYTSSFTVPTEPLTAVTNTKLLTCQSNRFIDKSSSNQPITVEGEPEIRPFSPFKNSAEYDPAVHGGSLYFSQHSTSWATVSHSTLFDFGTADYCLEAWVYPMGDLYPGTFNLPFAITGGNNYWGWTNMGSGYLGLTNHVDTLDSNSGATSETPGLYEWSHVVYQVTSGTNNWYVNGTRVYSGTAAAHSSAATGFQLGRSSSYNNHYYGGHLSDIRITTGNGYNPYSNASTLTVPTAPLTTGSYTRLLLSGTNAAAKDASGRETLRTYGNAQLNTSVKKFGTASMKFDETGDYAMIAHPPMKVPLGAGDFTVEGWVYFLAVATNGQGVFQFDTGGLNSQDGKGPGLGTYNGTGKWHIYYGAGENQNTTIGSSVAAPSQNTWYHFAFVRTSGVIKIFIDGTQIGNNISYTGDYRTHNNLTIGGWYSTGYLLNGYIDDFRITHKARYTSNFTAPTAAHPNI